MEKAERKRLQALEAAAFANSRQRIKAQEARLPEFYERYKTGELKSGQIADELGLNKIKVNRMLRKIAKSEAG
jgi:DNA-binding transcriptional regulator LsrR (DeoR family)